MRTGNKRKANKSKSKFLRKKGLPGTTAFQTEIRTSEYHSGRSMRQNGVLCPTIQKDKSENSQRRHTISFGCKQYLLPSHNANGIEFSNHKQLKWKFWAMNKMVNPIILTLQVLIIVPMNSKFQAEVNVKGSNYSKKLLGVAKNSPKLLFHKDNITDHSRGDGILWY